jgi:hypothetical protein
MRDHAGRFQNMDKEITRPAPSIKTAEILRENDNRQSCIANISECFRAGCADTFDPEMEEPQYDACITDPRAMVYICKSQLEACGIAVDTARNTADTNNPIWSFVVRRMAAMRDNACTREVRGCMASEDNCGANYASCFGMDMESLLLMCPQSRMVSCIDRGGMMDENRYMDLIMGILLNVDNEMLRLCQAALEAAMIDICGATDSCDEMVPDGIGGRSVKYEACEFEMGTTRLIRCQPSVRITDNLWNPTTGRFNESWTFNMKGQIHWGLIEINNDVRKGSISPSSIMTTLDQYKDALRGMFDVNQTQITALENDVVPELTAVSQAVVNAINMVESDPRVQMCVTGRDTSQIMRDGALTGGNTMTTRAGDRQATQARFPNLTQQARLTIANSVLNAAQQNYFRSFDREIARMTADLSEIDAKINNLTAEQLASDRCEALAENSAAARRATPPVIKPKKSWWKTALIAVAVVAAVACIAATAGVCSAAVVPALGIGGTAATATVTASSIAIGAAATATIVGGTIMLGSSIHENTQAGYTRPADQAWTPQDGHAQVANWNYEEIITTSLNRNTLQCTKIRRSRNCANRDNNRRICNGWADWTEEITNIPM